MSCDQKHFLGRCEDCDARMLAKMSLVQVENWYHQGVIPQHRYEGYRHVWARGNLNSSHAHGWVARGFADAEAFAELLVAELKRSAETAPK